MCRFNMCRLEYEIRLNIIEYNGVLHLWQRGSKFSEQYPCIHRAYVYIIVKIFPVVVFMNVLHGLHPTIKAQQKQSGENLANLTGGAVPASLLCWDSTVGIGNQRNNMRVTLLYKIINGIVDIDSEGQLIPTSTTNVTRGH